MSGHEEEPTVAIHTNVTERSDETSTSYSPDMIKEKIKANQETLHAQISVLTQMMDELI